MPQISEPHVNATSDGIDAGQAKGIDKSILTVAAPRRYRNREHLRSVAQQACILCGRKPSDPHHLGFTPPRALGRKVSDEFAVPLCRGASSCGASLARRARVVAASGHRPDQAQIPTASRRGAGRIVLSPVIRARLAAVFPGRHR